MHRIQSSSLGDGDKNISTIDDTSSTTGLAPLLAPSMASNADSWRMFYESWKYGNFTPSKAAEILSSDGIAALFFEKSSHVFFYLLTLNFGFALVIALHGYTFGPHSGGRYFQNHEVTNSQKYPRPLVRLRTEGRWRADRV